MLRASKVFGSKAGFVISPITKKKTIQKLRDSVYVVLGMMNKNFILPEIIHKLPFIRTYNIQMN